MKLTGKQIALLVELGGGTKEVVSRDHPHHHTCIKQAVENAFELHGKSTGIRSGIRRGTLQ